LPCVPVRAPQRCQTPVIWQDKRNKTVLSSSYAHRLASRLLSTSKTVSATTGSMPCNLCRCASTGRGAPEPKTSPTNLYTSAKRRSSGDNGSWIVTSCCDDKQSATQASSRGASFSPPFAVAVNESSWLGQHGPPPGKEHDAGQSIERRCGRMTAAERRGCGGEAEPVGLEEVLLRVAADLRGRLGRHEPLDGLPVAAEHEQRVQEEVVLVGRPLLPRPRDRVRLPGPLLPRRRRSREIPRIIRSRHHLLYICERNRDERWLARSCGVDT
jgi:hypothetical protein